MAVIIAVRCKEHPSYKAIRRPTVACNGCKGLYKFKHAALMKPGLGGIGGFTYDAAGAIDPETMTVYARTE
jgi:hypothetical protein